MDIAKLEELTHKSVIKTHYIHLTPPYSRTVTNWSMQKRKVFTVQRGGPPTTTTEQDSQVETSRLGEEMVFPDIFFGQFC